MSQDPQSQPEADEAQAAEQALARESGRSAEDQGVLPRPKEIGGPPGPEPTRFGDWEKGGRCIDF